MYLQKRALFPPFIQDSPHPDLGIVVVIPCHDEPDLVSSLQALKDCEMPNCAVEVIAMINAGEQAPDATKQQNELTQQQAQAWIAKNNTERFKTYTLFNNNLPRKFAGVGLARKIGMDEAVRRFESLGQNGVILCFDADSDCAKNYFQEVERHFQQHPKTTACSIHFEHPLEGQKYNADVYTYIAQYELHLRYYVDALQYAGHTHAYQTIGSSMAVRSKAYQQQGGMNRRKAGEDFYFLQKFIALGSFSELKTTMVIPSPRPSHRVPFGTGKAIVDLLEKNSTIFETYAPQSFIDLKAFLDLVPQFFEASTTQIETHLEALPKSIQSFLKEYNFPSKLVEIQSNTTNIHTFTQRFFNWFNAFIALKYVHYARDKFYPNISVEEATKWLLKSEKNINTKDLLLKMRQINKL